jgi:hypothetical protein
MRKGPTSLGIYRLNFDAFCGFTSRHRGTRAMLPAAVVLGAPVQVVLAAPVALDAAVPVVLAARARHGGGPVPVAAARRLLQLVSMSKAQSKSAQQSGGVRPESQQTGKPGPSGGGSRTATKGTDGRAANDRDGNANAEGKGAAKSRQSRK